MKQIQDKQLAEYVGMTPQGIIKMKYNKPNKYKALKTGCEILLNDIDLDLIKKYYKNLKIVRFE